MPADAVKSRGWDDDDWKRAWKKLAGRRWEDIRDAWVGQVPTYMSIEFRPDPGIERLPSLLQLPFDWPVSRHPDIEGIRSNALMEAVYLFHKCAHTNLASQRLASDGMKSWCLFNAYHSAYLGARGIMALLGVAFPAPEGIQIAVDLFPEPAERQSKKDLAANGPRFDSFLVMRLPKMDQRRVWEALQRLLRVCRADCWEKGIISELTSVRYGDITPPRNDFLYKAAYWPLGDLTSDSIDGELGALLGQELEPDGHGFLLRLSFLVYRLFERLIVDLGEVSPVIKEQSLRSRCIKGRDLPELFLYRDFSAAL